MPLAARALRFLRRRFNEMLIIAWLRPDGTGLVRLGTEYGGKWMPREALRPGAVAYSAGAGTDVSFELALAQAGVSVAIFDPTPRSVDYLSGLDLDGHGIRFVPVGWWEATGTLRFYGPAVAGGVSHSAINLYRSAEFVDVPVRAVSELAAELGDDEIDLIKMSIEGSEVRVVPSLLEHGITPATIVIEFDQPQPLRRIVAIIRQLRGAGYRAANVEDWDVTFVREAR